MQYERRPISRSTLFLISQASQPELFARTFRIMSAKKIARNSSLNACAKRSSPDAYHFVKISGPRKRTASVQLRSFLRAMSRARLVGVFQAIAARMPAAKESARANVIGMYQCEYNQSKYADTRSTGQTASRASKRYSRRRAVRTRTSGATTR